MDEPAFYELIETVVQRLKGEDVAQKSWLNTDEAMDLLSIKSKTTLQKLRDEGKIRFSQPQKKIIVYERTSIENYLEQNARNTF
jgi:hypothetical protein